MPKDKNGVNIDVDASKDTLSSSVNVTLGALNTGSTASTTVNSHEISDSTSSHLNIGSGYSESKSKDFSIGTGGLHTSKAQSTTIGGLEVLGSDSHFDVSKSGEVSFGDHATFFGKKVGYSGHFNPVEGLRKGVNTIGKEASKISAMAAAYFTPI